MLKVNHGELIVIVLKSKLVKEEKIGEFLRIVDNSKVGDILTYGKMIFEKNKNMHYTILSFEGQTKEYLDSLITRKEEKTIAPKACKVNIKTYENDGKYYVSKSIVEGAERMRDLLNYKVLDMKKNNINCTKEIKELEKIDNALCTVKAKGFAYKATWDAIMIMKKLANKRAELDSIVNSKYGI